MRVCELVVYNDSFLFLTRHTLMSYFLFQGKRGEFIKTRLGSRKETSRDVDKHRTFVTTGHGVIQADRVQGQHTLRLTKYWPWSIVQLKRCAGKRHATQGNILN